MSSGFAILMICLAATAIYSNTFHAPFVFDDQYAILSNQKIKHLDNFCTLGVLQTPRPLVDYTFALNYHFGNFRVFGYHLINLMIHIGNGLLVFYLACLLFQKQPEASNGAIYFSSLFAALIFVAHPLQTEAVTYISQRYTSMAALFYLASVLAYVSGRNLRVDNRVILRYGFYLIFLLCGVIAFFCKQNSASLPVAILFIEYACYDRTWSGWKKKFSIVLPFIGIMGCLYAYNMGFFRHEVQFSSLLEDVSKITQETSDVSRWRYLCTQFNVVAIYIRLLFFPVHQNLYYSYPFKTGFLDGGTPYAFIFLSGVIFFGWRCRKIRPIVFIGIMWFFITLSVESSIFPIRDAFFEHRLYLPMFGFSLVAAHFCNRMMAWRRLWAYGLMAAIVLFLSGTAYARNGVWENAVKLWSDSVSANPNNFRAINNLGDAWLAQGNLKAALSCYDDAIRLRPDYYLPFSNKGVVLARMGKTDDAINNFKKALDYNPAFSVALNNLSTALLEKADKLSASGDYPSAIDCYRESLRLSPKSVEGHSNLGLAYLRTGNNAAAVEQFKEALRIKPDSAEANANLGNALYIQGNYTDALLYLEAALRIRPDSVQIRQNIARIMSKAAAEASRKTEK